MDSITQGNTFEMSNVFSYRGQVTQQETTEIVRNMNQIMKDNGASKNGGIVTTTFSVDSSNGYNLLDTEILIPLDKQITVSGSYKFKPVFRLTNAVKIRHQGNPSMIQSSADALIRYIKENQLQPVTACYNVTVREPENNADFENMIIDLYIGVSDNIL